MSDRTVKVDLRANIAQYQRAMLEAGAATQGLAKRLDEADGKLSNVVQTSLALAPALAPIGAAAVPAIAGLTLQLGLAAGAAGTALLAFNGVGDGLKALNTFQAAPTAANFAKLQDQMDKLGPSGQEFVLTLDKMTPKFKQLKDLAEQGLLPDVGDSLQQMLQLMPQAESMVTTFSTTLGALAKEGADNLTDQRWVDFFGYIDQTAGPVLQEMGKTLGNVTEGLANMLQAFDPLSRDFSTGLLEMSRGFKDWSSSMSGSDGFSDFIDYVQANGPRVLDTLGAIGAAFVELVEAAAPVGQRILPVITALAEGVGKVADSPFGPWLVGLAAAVGTFGRSLALLKTVGLTGRGGSLVSDIIGVDKIKGATASTKSLAAAVADLRTAEEQRAAVATKTRDAQFALIPTKDKKSAVGDYMAAQASVEKASDRVREAEAKKAAAFRESAAALGKTTAMVGGFAIATSGLADKMGLSNTATMATMGLLVGPYGAAVGGAIGLAQDLAAANNDVEDSVKRSGAAVGMASKDFLGAQAAVDATAKSAASYSKTVASGKAGVVLGDPATWGNLKNNLTAVSDLWTHTGEESRKSAQQQQAAIQGTATVVAGFASDAGLGKIDPKNLLLLGQAADQLRPRFQAAGVDMDALATQISQGGAAGMLAEVQYNAMVSTWKAFPDGADAAAGVAAAMDQLNKGIIPTATAADQLKASLDGLFGVELSQSAATDNWTKSLQSLRTSIAATNGDLLSNSKAAMAARDATRTYVQAALDKANADALADGDGSKVARTLMATRDHIVATAQAAHASKKDIAELVAQMGLTPKNLVTIIETKGALSATEKVRALATLYDLTPRKIQTLISEAGTNPTRAKIEALAKQYGLTPRKVRTILDAVDNATRKAAVAATQARKFARLYSAVLDAKDNASAKAKAAQAAADAAAKKYWLDIAARDNASGVLHRISGLMGGLHSKTVTFTTIHRDVRVGGGSGTSANPTHNENGGFYRGSVRAFADGGFGSDGRYYDREPQIVAGGANILWGEKPTGWEAYISGKPGQEDRNRDVWRAAGEGLGMNWQEYMDGGLLSTYANGGGKGGSKKPTKAEKAEEKRHQAVKDFNLDAGQTWREVRSEFREFAKATGGMTKQLRHLEKAAEGVAKKYNDQQKALEDAKSKRDSLRTAAEDSFNGDLYGNGVAGLNLQLQADTNDATAFTVALDKLKGLGISKDFAESLSQSGDLNTAQQLAGMSASQVAYESQLYGSRETAQGNLGQTAVDIAGYTATIKDLNTTIKDLGHKLEHLEDRVERGARSGSHSGTKAGTEGKDKSTGQRKRTGR